MEIARGLQTAQPHNRGTMVNNMMAMWDSRAHVLTQLGAITPSGRTARCLLPPPGTGCKPPTIGDIRPGNIAYPLRSLRLEGYEVMLRRLRLRAEYIESSLGLIIDWGAGQQLDPEDLQVANAALQRMSDEV